MSVQIYSIISKLISESFLSLYPVFVKKIGLSIPLQLWTRLLAYVIISLFFVNYAFIKSNILQYNSLLLGFVNLAHIYFSYMGFKYLDSGVSFALFNTYPFMILLLSNSPWNNAYILAIIGFMAFIYENYIHNDFKKEDIKKEDIQKEDNTWIYHNKFLFGVIMIILSALTEAIIYFLIKGVKTENSWNHLFISYFLGAVIISIYFLIVYIKKGKIEEFNQNEDDESRKITQNQRIIIALLLNGFIGALGYTLRFYSAYRLNPQIYAILSYFGIIMAYIYGIVMNNEKLTGYKVFGTLCIILANYMILGRK